jgi:hypothetical protein
MGLLTLYKHKFLHIYSSLNQSFFSKPGVSQCFLTGFFIFKLATAEIPILVSLIPPLVTDLPSWW